MPVNSLSGRVNEKGPNAISKSAVKSRDEDRQIAARVADLPELLRKEELCVERKRLPAKPDTFPRKGPYYDPLHSPNGQRRIGDCICPLWRSHSLVWRLSLASNTRPLNFVSKKFPSTHREVSSNLVLRSNYCCSAMSPRRFPAALPGRGKRRYSIL